MKKRVFAIFGLVSLLGIAATSFGVLSNQGSAKAAPAEESSKEKATSSGPVYVDLAPLMLPVIGARRPEQLIMVKVSLEVDSLQSASDVNAQGRRLTDAYMQVLYGALSRGGELTNEHGLVDVGKLKVVMGDATQRVLGGNMVKDVLVQAVTQRRL